MVHSPALDHFLHFLWKL